MHVGGFARIRAQLSINALPKSLRSLGRESAADRSYLGVHISPAILSGQ